MRNAVCSVLTILIALTAGVAEDFVITPNALGVGNTWNTNEITPLQITLTSSKDEATSAWVQWEVPDGDGDTVMWGKPITLAPNGETNVWLYAPVEPWATASTRWTIRLREWIDGEPQGELASTQFSSTSIGAVQHKKNTGCIAVFGSRRLGLEGYQPFQPSDVKPESSIILSGLQLKDLPDAWPCLDSLDAIVWADTPPQFTYHQEKALIRWIERGGHFIISLPTIGDFWNLGSEQGPLSTLFGGIEHDIEQVSLSSFSNILGRNKDWPFVELTVRTFPEEVTFGDSLRVPLAKTNRGQTFAIQGTFGFGAVSIIGVDLASGQLASVGLPETDVFWNRILGKRGDTPSQHVVTRLKEDNQLSFSIPTQTTLDTERLVAQEIAMSTTASGRLGTIFIIVLLYFLCSGPICFLILRKKQKQRWSWALFATVALTFTFITWGLAGANSSVKTQLKHVSIVDHIFGGNAQRVTGWCSIFLPSFQNTLVSLDGNEENLLVPWATSDSDSLSQFVDHREVAVNLEHVPDSFDQPSRATTSNYTFDWLGGMNHPFYDSLIRVALHDEPSWQPMAHSIGTLEGSIINHASQAIKDVTIIWITDLQHAIPALGKYQNQMEAPWVSMRDSGRNLNQGFAWRIPSWESGESIDLSTLQATSEASLTATMKNRYQPGETDKRLIDLRVQPKRLWRKQFEMLSLFSVLEPPSYLKRAESKQSPKSFLTTRLGGRSLDFAEWFGKPCIIVMGFIPNSPIPVPISLDGEEIKESSGETFVRWIYPLGEFQ